MPSYRFGAYLLDTDLRTLKRDGELVAAAPKVVETLTVLIQNRGRVMTKDELLRVLWPDTVVEEANLTQNVSVLRRLLGDDARTHRYIVTIPGKGYSFVAPVTEVPSGTSNFLKGAGLPARWGSEYQGMVYAVIIACVLLAGGGMYVMYVQRHHLSEPVTLRFTSFPGIETMPAFSPDGKQVAYVRSEHDPIGLHYWRRQVGQANIYTRLTEAGTELRLTWHPGADYFPAWSPDGQYIAFYRDEPAASGCYVVSALGGEERQITHEETEIAGLAWLPDGRHLAISHFSEGSHAAPLMEISLETGQQRPLTFPPAETLGDTSPAISPDGKILAFLRAKNPRTVDACFMPLSGGKLRCWPLEGGWTEGLAWTAGGNGIIVSAIRSAHHRLWRYHINGGAPTAVTSDEEEAGLPAVSRQGNQLAYVLSGRNVNLWELNIDGSPIPAVVKPEDAKAIATSSRFQSDPAFSPDVRKIAFLSDRSGTREIWVTAIKTQTSTQLTHFKGPPAGSPSWSPDGLEIAFDLERGAGSDIYIISADGGAARRITAARGENVAPSWSRDGKFVYFGSSRSGEFQIWKALAATGETPANPAIRITQRGGFRALESADGKYLYYAKGRSQRGLWRQRTGSTQAGEEEPVLASLQDWGWWSLGPGLIYFFETPHSINPRVHLKELDIPNGDIRELCTLRSPVLTSTPAMTVSADGQHLAYAQIDAMQADVILVENFR
jgi:Tol biopolymer transport system component/DNA-binding winged helix-turn-helix (wHTH) protein